MYHPRLSILEGESLTGEHNNRSFLACLIVPVALSSSTSISSLNCSDRQDGLFRLNFPSPISSSDIMLASYQ